MILESNPPELREYTTFGARLFTFALSLALLGVFFLPWIRVDGMSEASSGAELIALAFSPTFEYLFSVSQTQAGILVGSPALMLLSTIVLSTKYRRRSASPISICAILVSAVLLILATPDLTESGDGAYSGLIITIAVSSFLLIHQVLIKVGRKAYVKYRFLPVVTGQGFYRWRDN